MRKQLSAEARHAILHPPIGSALARARDYGIDLTILARNIELTPQELLQNVVRAQALARMTRTIRDESRHGK